MKENKQFYSDDELVIRLWDKEKVKDTMSRWCYYTASNQRREALNELWVRRNDSKKTASLGVNTGYYIGINDISNFLVVQNEENEYKKLKEYSDNLADIPCDSLHLGLGQMTTNTVNTPLVELAADGRTAQYLACTSGQKTYGHPDGTADCYFVFGQIFADLVKEGDEWRIWHLKIHHDHTVPADHVPGAPVGGMFGGPPPGDGAPGGAPGGPDGPGAGGPPMMGPSIDMGPDPIVEEFGTPTMPMDAYIPYWGWNFLPQMMPVPYEYFESEKGYGPDGQFEYVL